jgi:DNA mismatch repair protein MutS2
VPNSLGLDDSRQTILVTGPNTGGKTITLKTVGLSILMAQSGMHIAADDTSTVGIFEAVFADIGDEQSIEQSLSTFSSHIRNIIHGLNGASDKTLLLFDEIGVGTDPKEGSALAESIILHAVNKGSRMVATTHYSQLKVLPTGSTSACPVHRMPSRSPVGWGCLKRFASGRLRWSEVQRNPWRR